MNASRAPSAPIGISLGDPAGIGPEIIVKALAARPGLPVVVYGDPAVLAATSTALGLPPVPPQRVRPVETARAGAEQILPGRPNLASAAAQQAALEAATNAALRGEIAALCTAPISKDWIARVGFAFPGHTEYLADRAGVKNFAMMLAGPRLRVVLATTHVALRDVATRLTPADITRAAVLGARALARSFGIARPRVAVAGLNPHAGEAGRFGDEETRVVAPAIAAARARLAAPEEDDDGQDPCRAELSGPHPPDTVFRQAALGAYDAVIALYHDQGLIPVKLLHFDEAVNVTLGLPFVRTSPDHGTAYDIAGTNRADPSSFLAALDLAARLAKVADRPAD
jgi:4-hydroxythreonine-4-phosphate dehydrogenase